MLIVGYEGEIFVYTFFFLSGTRFVCIIKNGIGVKKGHWGGTHMQPWKLFTLSDCYQLTILKISKILI